MFTKEDEQPRGPLTPDEIREAFPDWEQVVTEKICEYEAEREALQDETRFDLFCLPDLHHDENDREWVQAFIEANFDRETKRINRELRRLRSLLPVKRRNKSDSRQVLPDHVERARQRACEELLGPPARRSGKYAWWGCPFHDDARPSFAVSSENRWRCWAGCGSGDAIDLYMRLHNVDFIATVQALIGDESP